MLVTMKSMTANDSHAYASATSPRLPQPNRETVLLLDQIGFGAVVGDLLAFHEDPSITAHAKDR